jgi:phosphate transport system ATP-binding protein
MPLDFDRPHPEQKREGWLRNGFFQGTGSRDLASGTNGRPPGWRGPPVDVSRSAQRPNGPEVNAMDPAESASAAPPGEKAVPMQGDTGAPDSGIPSISITMEERAPLRANPPKATAEKLDFWYGDNHALKDINIVVRENQVTALIGPSGCGKSTFLRCFNRMHDLQPDTRYGGSITLRPDNMNLVGSEIDPIEVRMRIGMVFQKPNPFPKSIFENVAYGLRLRGIRNRAELAERVEKALRGAAIWDEVKDRLDDSALALSGGQMQRLCIARALATEPEILLFDEPTSALDPIATAKIEELITELRERVTVLIVTHNMQQAARVSDYTAFMYLGELVEVDVTSKIFTNPARKATEDYITGRYG